MLKLIGLCAALAAGTALAQAYSVTTGSAPYAPLSGATAVTFSPRGFFGAADEGFAEIPLGFSFPFYGTSYSSVFVDTNGFLSFGQSCVDGCLSPRRIPITGTGTPHNLVAPWWADLDTSSGQVRYLASPGQLAIEFNQIDDYGGEFNVTFTVTLKASGAMVFSYGPFQDFLSFGKLASAGVEDSTGAQGLVHLASCVSATATSPGCGAADWPTAANNLITVDIPLQPDLLVESVAVSNVVDNGTTLSMNVLPTFRNAGRTDAPNFLWRAYLSTDRIRDAADLPLVVSAGPVTAPGSGNVSASAPGSTPSPGAGAYFVLVEADFTNVITEANETNNVGSSLSALVQGRDLVAQAISGPTASGPETAISLPLKFQNQGIASAGTVTFSIYLSTDEAYQLGDFQVFSGTRLVTGGQTIDETIALTLPVNVPGGEFFWLLNVDPANTVVEVNEGNNVIASAAKVLIRQADLANGGVELLDPATGAPTRVAYFGEPSLFRFDLRNVGGADAKNFKVGVVISADANLSLLSDTLTAETDVALLAPGAARQLTVPFTMPLNDKNGAPFKTGTYFLYGVLDTRSSVVELGKGNNNLILNGPVALKAPAADLIVSRVDAPAAAGVGELLPVFRELRNLGNRAAPASTYRYFASANPIITEQDFPLQIVAADGSAALEGTVTLGVREADGRSELVRLPATMPAGTYYLGVVADFGSQVAEFEEGNNTQVSNPVVVAGSSLRISGTSLLDGALGRPYQVRLSVEGATGPVAWAHLAAQGPLPAGLALGADGTVSGTPTATGVSAFTVTATQGTRVATARLAMRVLSASSQLEITQSNLPPAINSPTLRYETKLGASGGTAPYTWRVAGGALPPGLALSATGVLAGNLRSGQMEAATVVSFEVIDAWGSRARRELTVRVVAPGAIAFESVSLPDALVGNPYDRDIAVANTDGSALATPLVFSVSSGALPDGLALQNGAQVLLITGKPRVAGVYPFTLTVADARGRTDSTQYVVRVYAAGLQLQATPPAGKKRGEPVEFAITSSSGAGTVFTFDSGVLPKGVSLSADGTIKGTIAEDADLGSYNFVVVGRDGTGTEGVGAFTFRVESPEVKAAGCSASGAGALAWLSLLWASALRRKRRALVTAAALAVALVAPAARAQDYVVSGPSPAGLESLTAASTVSVGGAVAIPFSFKFYGVSYSSVNMAGLGYLVFSGSTTVTTNVGIPTVTVGPDTFIAPWWDSLATTGATLRTQTLGVAPLRRQVFEWNGVYNGSAASRMIFQAVLFEGTNQVRMIYGGGVPSTASATLGIQRDRNTGIAPLVCGGSGNCATTSYPANSALDFFTRADLTISSLNAEQVGYTGVAYRASATLRNIGGATATGVVVRFYLSTDSTLEVGTDTLLGSSPSVDVPPFTDVIATSTSPIPAAITSGNFFVFAVVDPDNLVIEQSETNNGSAPATVRIGAPTADLTVSGVTAPSTAAPGATLTLPRTVTNIGNAAAASFKYSWLLSDNAVVTISDLPLTPLGTIAGLAPGQASTAMDSVLIPSTVPPGRYWLGLCANFDAAANPPFGIDEITRINNCITAPAATVITSGELNILTTTLPAASQFGPYSLRLEAAGGAGLYQWSLAGGSLPLGMSLSASGELSGAPSKAETASFEVKVASGGAEKTRALTLSVTAGDLPLTIVDQDLPAAEFSRNYSVPLVGVGGKPPYAWALKTGSKLPAGLALATDGLVEGRAAEAGDFTFSVELKDTGGAVASKELAVRVVNPVALSIATSRLGTAYLRKQYLQPLQAVGGRAPYDWSLVRIQQLPENATEKPSAPAEMFPQAFGIAIERSASGVDFLRGVPKLAGLFSVTLKAADSTGVSDQTTLLLRVSYEEGLAITTTALPDAFIGQPYLVKLSTNAEAGQVLSFSEPCLYEAKKVDEFACQAKGVTNVVPPGLTLKPDGTIDGSATDPNALAAELKAPTTFSFLVKLVDEQGRQDVRALSIRVQPAVKKETGGCSGAGGLPQSLTLVALAALAARRRRASLSRC